jgi:hypothetical protein
VHRRFNDLLGSQIGEGRLVRKATAFAGIQASPHPMCIIHLNSQLKALSTHRALMTHGFRVTAPYLALTFSRGWVKEPWIDIPVGACRAFHPLTGVIFSV